MKFGKLVVKFRIPILILSLILMIPSVIGMARTRVNYDMLTYLPEDMDTVIGQNELMKDFHKGAFTFLILENMQDDEVRDLMERLKAVIRCFQRIFRRKCSLRRSGTRFTRTIRQCSRHSLTPGHQRMRRWRRSERSERSPESAALCPA